MTKKERNNYLTVGLVALAFFMFTRRGVGQGNNSQYPYYQFENVPAAPIQSQSALIDWIQAIVAVYGVAAPLFEPGQPFYNLFKKDAEKEIKDGMIDLSAFNQINWNQILNA